MSDQFRFKISKRCFIINSIIILCGIIVASIFIMFSGNELMKIFSEQIENYFQFESIYRTVLLIFQESFWVLLIAAFAKISFGNIMNLLILFYKGFSIGVVSSVFSSIYGFSSLKHILLLILPPNLFYISSLCIAAQISIEYAANTVNGGKHMLEIETDRRAYFLSLLLVVIGVLNEALMVPWIYSVLF